MIPTLCFAVGVCLTFLIDARLLLALRRENDALRTRVHSEYWRGISAHAAQTARLRHPLRHPMVPFEFETTEGCLTLAESFLRSPHSEGSR